MRYLTVPLAQDWFLVKGVFWPLFICATYCFAATCIAPPITRRIKGYEIGNFVAAYDLAIVLVYLSAAGYIIYNLLFGEQEYLCREHEYITKDLSNSPQYKVALALWVLYMVKYVEFLDTVFFVIRKKANQLTHLHIIHHALLPILSWLFIKAEKSGFQLLPVLANSSVHIVMYTYYFLTALGPSVRKHLWWKRYVTLMQLSFFVTVLVLVHIIGPLMGCTLSRITVLADTCGAILFFSLFYNFYKQTYVEKSPKKKKSA